MFVCKNAFIGNFKMCSCQCHIIATAVRFQNFTVIVRDEQTAEQLFGPKVQRATKCWGLK